MTQIHCKYQTGGGGGGGILHVDVDPKIDVLLGNLMAKQQMDLIPWISNEKLQISSAFLDNRKLGLVGPKYPE